MSGPHSLTDGVRSTPLYGGEANLHRRRVSPAPLKEENMDIQDGILTAPAFSETDEELRALRLELAHTPDHSDRAAELQKLIEQRMRELGRAG